MIDRPVNWYAFMDEASRYHEEAFPKRMQALKNANQLKSGVGIIDGAILHTLVKWYQPTTIVETGTYFGFSSAFFIQAFKDFGIDGKVYTIDIDQSRDLSIVLSDQDREKYLVRLEGDAFEMAKAGKIPEKTDFFFHDSVHCYDYQLKEFEFFWKKLNAGGFLTSHDVAMNAAFPHFISTLYQHDAKGYASEATECSAWGGFGSLGFVRKK